MFGVPLQTSDTSRGPYYAGTPPAGVTRQLPGRESVPLWSPFKPEGPAPAFRWQKTTCGVGEEARVAFQFHCSRLVCGGKAKRGSLRKLCIFVFYHKGSFLFHFPVSTENREVHTMIWQMTSKTYEALTLAAWTWARCFELRTRLQPQ